MRIGRESVGVLLAVALLILPGTAVAGDKTGVSVTPGSVKLSTLSPREIRRILPSLKRIEDKAAVKYVNDNMEHPQAFEAAYFRRVEAESRLFDYEAPAWLKQQSIYGHEHKRSVGKRRHGARSYRAPRTPEPSSIDDKVAPVRAKS